MSLPGTGRHTPNDWQPDDPELQAAAARVTRAIHARNGWGDERLADALAMLGLDEVAA